MKAVVNKIIPFSSVDGPGNRTAIFLQGCNINCKYCHNPETRGMCNACGACVAVCPKKALSKVIDSDGNCKIIFDRDKCIECDACIHICQNDSSPRTMIMDEDMVFAEVSKQIPFIRGITISGGECMLRPEFVMNIFAKAKEASLTTFIDTNGTVDFSLFPELLKVTDGVMLDIKAFGNEEHYNVTGYGNETVIKNAKLLAKLGLLYEVRVVVVPNLYNATESVRAIGELLADFNKAKSIRIKLISYRPIGVREEYKYLEVPSKEYMLELSDILLKQGFSDIVII